MAPDNSTRIKLLAGPLNVKVLLATGASLTGITVILMCPLLVLLFDVCEYLVLLTYNLLVTILNIRKRTK